MKRIGLIWVGLMLIGCNVGPDYQKPKANAPKNWSERKPSEAKPSSQSKSVVVSGSEPVDQWWTTLDDPMLTRLIQHAAGGNLDLRQARLRVVQARAQRDVVAGGEYPEVSANGSYEHRRISENGVASAIGGGSSSGGGATNAGAPAIPGSALEAFNLFQTGFDASWELDVFGGVRRQIQSAEARYEAAIENLRGARVTLAAEVARNYLRLRGAQRRVALTRKNLDSQKRTLELTRSQKESGLGDQVDVQRAASRVSRTQAEIPRLQIQVQRSIHRLSVLVGKAPSTLAKQLGKPKALPDLPPKVPVGLPSTVLRRRPDIRRAERQLAAATADIGVAVAELFPKFSLTGSFGFQSTEIDELAKWQSRFFGIGPAVKVPIFQGGRLRATVRVRKAQRAQAVNRYRNTVLRAMREVEDALVAYRKEQARRRSLADAVDSDRQAVGLSRQRYKQGLTDYLTVLDAQRTLLQSEDDLARSALRVRTNLIALYKALGGGRQLNPMDEPQPSGRQTAKR